MIRIKKGLDLPISGQPSQEIGTSPKISSVALIGDDFVGMRPTMAVDEGQQVQKGQLLFTDKKTEGVGFTSPIAGTVKAVHRGAKRKFESIVIEAGGHGEVEFKSFDASGLEKLSRDEVVSQLLDSGLWTALRMRPFGKVPSPQDQPHSLFVTAMDTNPLAPTAELILKQESEAFTQGLHVLRPLTDGKLFVCHKDGEATPGADASFVDAQSFAGPHPAGLPGTHIHFLDPIGPGKAVWNIGYQDVIAIGKLFATGRLDTDRVISIAGPSVKQPRLVKAPIGSSLTDLVAGELEDGEHRVISGSVLAGRASREMAEHLGRYHLQVSALREGREREFLGWQRPGFNKFSVKRVFASALSGGRKFAMSTSTEGSIRAMVPVGSYEQVMPLDILPTFLLRSLIVGDTEQAQALGCLELDEEDLALCTYVCPGKTEYGPLLRAALERIEKEG